MLTPHPLQALALADRRAQDLQLAAKSERCLLRRHAALATLLRFAGDRLDPVAPLAQRPASQS